MKIRIDQLNEWDAEALFSFEVKNRSYFKKMVPDRGMIIITLIVQEQARPVINRTVRGTINILFN